MNRPKQIRLTIFSLAMVAVFAEDPPVTRDPSTWPAEVRSAFNSALEQRGNDARRLAEFLYDDNHRLREDKRKLRTDLDEVNKRLPEGAVVLNKEDAAAWETFKALGKPDEVKKTLEKAASDATELEGLKFSDMVNQAAGRHNFKPTVLADVVKARGLKIELGEIEVPKAGSTTGEKVKQQVAYVVTDDKGTKVVLADYAKDRLAEYLPSLAAGNGQQQQNGQTWVSQQGTPAPNPNQPQGGDRVSTFLEQRNAQRSGEKPAERTEQKTTVVQ